ncbi:DUF1294 domain-containing protein [Clostridium swellfunianum]|uniref:DUF1294 domain-containing protein n=1 Tax=Clostridium swellfunianum TaxID=1367462 RepID=UPI00202E1B1B|nr:DUF1294 domain-containing protein [Clostridium swellfunianum]MCM0648315.1 DUF1294 domain-containing protein [Clostridium swellfunianum]
MFFIFLYLLAINIFAVFVMYSDKKKARKGYWRVPEQDLFIIALLFGGPGILIGMKLFRHKTRHFKFVYGIPAIIVVQLYLLYKLIVFLS